MFFSVQGAPKTDISTKISNLFLFTTSRPIFFHMHYTVHDKVRHTRTVDVIIVITLNLMTASLSCGLDWMTSRQTTLWFSLGTTQERERGVVAELAQVRVDGLVVLQKAVVMTAPSSCCVVGDIVNNNKQVLGVHLFLFIA